MEAEASVVEDQRVNGKSGPGDPYWVWILIGICLLMAIAMNYGCRPRYDKYGGDTLRRGKSMPVNRPKRPQNAN